MKKIAILMLLCFVPNISLAFERTCSGYDHEVGRRISNLFYSMYQMHLQGNMPYGDYDEIKTAIHQHYNINLQIRFKKASVGLIDETCEQIGNEAIAWIETYPGMINDRFGKRN